MNKTYMYELTKLMVGLAERGIDFTFNSYMGGGVITVLDNSWDAICHDGSYGHQDGLLEIMGTLVDESKTCDTVEGWLTADEILSRLDK